MAALVCLSAPASGQQSLALTYKLDARPDIPQQAPTAAMNRCAGFNWMTSIGACGRELFAGVAPARASGAYSKGNVVEPTEVAGFPDLSGPAPAPALATPAPEPRIRAGGGRETLISSSRAADLMFRLGSKSRARGNDDSGGWDAYKFTDTNYESHVQNNGHKALGLELLVPFH